MADCYSEGTINTMFVYALFSLKNTFLIWISGPSLYLSGTKDTGCYRGVLGNSYHHYNFFCSPLHSKCAFPGGSNGKGSACNARDLGLIPGLGRSPGEGNGNPLQYSCLENPTDREAWRDTVHEVAKSWA